MPEQPDPFELFGLEPSTPQAPPASPSPATPTSSAAETPAPRSMPAATPAPAAANDGNGGEFVAVKGGGGSGGGGRWALLIGVPLIVLALFIAAAGFWVKGKIDPGSQGEEVAFSIAKGETTSQIATSLAEK